MKIKVKYLEESKNNEIKNNNYIAIYILGVIKLKEIKINNTIKEDPKIKNRVADTIITIVKQIIKSIPKKQIANIITKILKTVKVKKLNLDLGINLQDKILNAYLIAIINAVFPTLIASNNKNFNINQISYNTYISKQIISLQIDTVVTVSILRNIPSIIQAVWVMLKLKQKEK